MRTIRRRSMKRFLARIKPECYMDIIVEADDKDEAWTKLNDYMELDYVVNADLNTTSYGEIESIREIGDDEHYSCDDLIEYEELCR